MPKGFQKFCVLFLILALNGSAFLGVGETHAYFSDTAQITGNTFSAGILNFEINEGEWVLDSILAPNDPDSITRNVNITNTGTLGSSYKWKIEIDKDSSDTEFCEEITLVAELNDNEEEREELEEDFVIFEFNLKSGNIDNWKFILERNDPQTGGTCKFDFVFEAWQENLPDNTSGFTFSHTISNAITNCSNLEEIECENLEKSENQQTTTNNEQQTARDEDDVDDDDLPVSDEGDLEEEGIDEGGDDEESDEPDDSDESDEADEESDDIDEEGDDGEGSDASDEPDDEGDDTDEGGDTEGGEEEENGEGDGADNDNDDNNDDNNDGDTEDNSNADNDSEEQQDDCVSNNEEEDEDEDESGDEDDIGDDDDEDNGDDNDDSDNNDE